MHLCRRCAVPDGGGRHQTLGFTALERKSPRGLSGGLTAGSWAAYSGIAVQSDAKSSYFVIPRQPLRIFLWQQHPQYGVENLLPAGWVQFPCDVKSSTRHRIPRSGGPEKPRPYGMWRPLKLPNHLGVRGASSRASSMWDLRR